MKQKMCLGMPTLIEKPKFVDCLALCQALGLDFIELNMNLPEYQLENIDADQINELLAKSGLFVTIHLDENFNVCDFNSKVADAYVQTALDAIALAIQVQAPVINMHMAAGIYFTLPERRVYLFDEFRQHYIEKLTRFRDACAQAIGNSPVRICIENSDGYSEYMREGIKTLLQSDVFALTWDIGHDHAVRSADTAFILENAARVMHMHIHDALGQKNHLVLGSGEVDIAKRLAFAQARGCRCVIETKTVAGLEQSVSYLRKIFPDT